MADTKCITNILITLCVIWGKIFGITALDEDMDDDMAMAFLKQYNYMGSGHPDSVMHNDSMYPEALMMYQMMSGLNQTGMLDDDTKEMMNTPRCALPDIEGKGDMMKKRRRRYAVQGSKWRGGRITYSYDDSVPSKGNVNREMVQQSIDSAFQTWARFANLYFTKLDQGGDIQISFVSREHGDGFRLDGPGKAFAHAFYPFRSPLGGDMHFDDDETWKVDNSANGVDLHYVALHEIGHSLGLKHSMYENSIMRPDYPKESRQATLMADDIEGITAIYGRRGPQITPRPTHSPTDDMTRFRQEFCGAGRVDAIGTLGDMLYAFQGDLYVELDGDGIRPGYPRRATDDWEKFPGNPDAALALTKHNILLLFKDTKYWRYSASGMEFKLANGYPRNISGDFVGLPAKVDGAFQWSRNGRLYFISDGQYYRINANYKVTNGAIRARTDRGYPVNFASWNVKGNVNEAALYHGRTFFFTNITYIRYNDRKYKSDLGYPKSVRESWFGCESAGSIGSIRMEMDMMEQEPAFDEIRSHGTSTIKMDMNNEQAGKPYSSACRVACPTYSGHLVLLIVSLTSICQRNLYL